MKGTLTKWLLPALVVSGMWCGAASDAAEKKPVEIKKSDKCQVCGMMVSAYPKWVAQVIFKDGSYAAFDGPKDMFKYYLNVGRYNPARKQADILAVYVTEYYSARLTEAQAVLRPGQRCQWTDGGRARAGHDHGKGKRIHERSWRQEDNEIRGSAGGRPEIVEEVGFLLRVHRLLSAAGRLPLRDFGEKSLRGRPLSARPWGNDGGPETHGHVFLDRRQIHPPPVAGRPLFSVSGLPGLDRTFPFGIDRGAA